jgi:hypothetical protein
MEKEVVKATSFKFGDTAFDIVAMKNGNVEFIKYHAGEQKIVGVEIDIGGMIHVPPVKSTRKIKLIIPSGHGTKKTPGELITDIKAYLKKVVKFPSENDLEFVACYILSTYNYDAYSDVCYISATGNAGCGKSCLLAAMSQLSYATLVGSGLDSAAAIARGIHSIKGTLSLDEVQRGVTDAASEFHKILALGNNVNGVINKCNQIGKTSTFENEGYCVFGPKLLSGRSVSTEEAILSRTYEVKMTKVSLKDIQAIELLSLDNATAKQLADEIRNNLLLYRQRRQVGELEAPNLEFDNLIDEFSPRDFQVYRWMLSECPNNTQLKKLIRAIEGQLSTARNTRTFNFEYNVLAAAFYRLKANPKGILLAKNIADDLENLGDGKFSSKSICSVFRNNQIEVKRCKLGATVVVGLKQLTEVFNANSLPVPATSFSSPSSPEMSGENQNDLT